NAACTGPAVSSISPNSGSTGGGTIVTISGTDFLSGATVSIGGVSASSVNVVNPTTITAVTRAHPAGAVDVPVTNPAPQPGPLPPRRAGACACVARVPPRPVDPPVQPPVQPPGLQPPGAPTSLSGLVAGSTVTLAWSAPSSGDPATNYVVEAGTFTGASDAA